MGCRACPQQQPPSPAPAPSKSRHFRNTDIHKGLPNPCDLSRTTGCRLQGIHHHACIAKPASVLAVSIELMRQSSGTRHAQLSQLNHLFSQMSAFDVCISLARDCSLTRPVRCRRAVGPWWNFPSCAAPTGSAWSPCSPRVRQQMPQT